MLRRADQDTAVAALAKAGFVYRQIAGVDMLLDGADASPCDAVHVVFADERVRPHYVLPAPDVSEAELAGQFRVLVVLNLAGMRSGRLRFRPCERAPLGNDHAKCPRGRRRTSKAFPSANQAVAVRNAVPGVSERVIRTWIEPFRSERFRIDTKPYRTRATGDVERSAILNEPDSFDFQARILF